MGCGGSKDQHGALHRGGDDGANKNCAAHFRSGKTRRKTRPFNGLNGNGGGAGQAMKHGRVGGGGGIAAYMPDEETSNAYKEYVRTLRRSAVAQGLLPAVAGDCPPVADSTCDRESDFSSGKISGSSALKSSGIHRVMSDGRGSCVSPPVRTITVYQLQPLTGDTVIAVGRYSEVHLARLSVFTGVSGESVNATVPRNTPTRRGTISRRAGDPGVADVSSVAISVDMTSADSSNSGRDTIGAVAAHGTVQPRGSIVAPTALLDAAPAGKTTMHYVIAMKEIPLLPSNATRAVLERVCLEVRRWARLSTYCTRFLRCYQLEYVSVEGISTPVPKASCHYFPALDAHGRSAGGSLITESSPTGASGPAEAHMRAPSQDVSHIFAGRSNRPSNASANSSPSRTHEGVPQKLRLYLEYAKYGNLQAYQMREMPRRFGRRRLHELTARAYMRDVLLALLHLHDSGEVQHDLCAKEVFLSRPILSVYRTYFPAYISDLPASDLRGVMAAQLMRSQRLLDRAPPLLPPPPLLSPPTNDGASQELESPANKLSNSVKSVPLKHRRGSGGEQRNVDPFPAQCIDNPATLGARHIRNSSMLVHDTSMPMLEAFCAQPVTEGRAQVSRNNNTSDQKSGAAMGVVGNRRDLIVKGRKRVGADHGSVALSGSTSELRFPALASRTASLSEGDLRGGPAKVRGRASYFTGPGSRRPRTRSSGGSLHAAGVSELSCGERNDDADHHHLHRTYLRFMNEFVFERTDNGESAPFPSPHDGVRGQKDAEMLASTMLPREPREPPPMRVVALQRTSLGGIAVLSPDHYVVKSADTPLSDMRGRIPMLLSSLVPGAALFSDDPPHQRQVTCGLRSSGAPTSVGSPSTGPRSTAQALSGGTSAPDAIASLGRGGAPLVKLNHSSAIRRALVSAGSDTLEDVPVQKYVTVTHAAPEVLQHGLFSPASDIYAFAMTFLELVTDDGVIMKECLPKDLPQPVTRRAKEVYNDCLAGTINRWYQASISALHKNYEAMSKEQEPPKSVLPHPGPIVVSLPPYLSDECKSMLRWCLQSDPTKRPTAAELLRSRYFMLGDWIATPSTVAPRGNTARMPETPWVPSAGFDEAVKEARRGKLRAT
ncbi:hypothetical protein JKF63_04258 [Porcisia hertigi]|uniref:Protein kinase domain-containing protein n=1 Tax=Porcisia hertigi TaxID=2761500 RepID=A0A836HLI8_9TRYP|nr:hypothetical protein JKF63_04258 [Porcisia hertigi]